MARLFLCKCLMAVCAYLALSVDLLLAEVQMDEQQAIEVTYAYPDAVYHPVFTLDQQPILHLQFSSKTVQLTDAAMRYQVHDFWGRLIDHGNGSLEHVGGQATALLKPNVQQIGWYRLAIQINDVKLRYAVAAHPKSMDMGEYLSFAIVPTRRQADAKSIGPIGLDAAIAACDPQQDQRLVSLANMTGCNWVRDRISWRAMNTMQGQYDWHRYDALFELYQRAQLPVLLSYASSPQWAREQDEQSYPSDLFAAYQFGHDCATHWKDSVFAWEIWNEPDIAVHSKETPDRYAAMLKAIALGYRSLPDRPLIAMGPLARELGAFSEIFFANGVAPYLDVYDFHSYAPYDTGLFSRVIEEHIQAAHASGFTSYWMSEIGRPFARGSVPDPQLAAAQQAVYLVQVYATALSMGVERTSWFLLRPYWGGGPCQFGLLRADLSPQPAYQAMAVLCKQLGPACYAGSLPMEHGRIHLFSQGKDNVAVVLPLESTVSLPASLHGTASSQIVDLMGGRQALSLQACRQQLATHPGEPFYITHVTSDAIVPPVYPRYDTVARQAQASKVVAMCRVPVQCVISEAGTPKSNWDGLATGWAPLAYQVTPGQTLEFPVDFYNFQDNPATLSITMTTTDPQVLCIPVAQHIQLPGMAMRTYSLSLQIPTHAKPFDLSIHADINGQSIPMSLCRFEPTQP